MNLTSPDGECQKLCLHCSATSFNLTFPFSIGCLLCVSRWLCLHELSYTRSLDPPRFGVVYCGIQALDVFSASTLEPKTKGGALDEINFWHLRHATCTAHQNALPQVLHELKGTPQSRAPYDLTSAETVFSCCQSCLMTRN